MAGADLRAARRAKIVATIGPASSSPAVLDELVRAGMDVARLNCSHGAASEREEIVAHIREASLRHNRAVAILLDLQGPKIRTGRLVNGEPVTLVEGQRLTITTRAVAGTSELIATSYDPLPRSVHPGEAMLLADGSIELSVLSTSDDAIVTEIITGGVLAERQGINLPGGALQQPALTKKDIDDLQHGLTMGVDYVALSFVRTAQDVRDVKQRIRELGHTTPVIAKIEKPQAVEQLENIIAASDGVMVARGDLGVEMPLEKVPVIQKRITRLARQHQVPVIVATQMLESMIQHERPTRAEVSDVANAIFDSVDAVMLSGETAVGRFPVQAVETMDRVIVEAEGLRLDLDEPSGLKRGDYASLARAAVNLARDVRAKAIIAITRTGYTGQLMASLRPETPIVAVTTSEEIRRQLALWWGLTCIVEPFDHTTDASIARAVERLRARGFVSPGDTVIATGGGVFPPKGRTNYIRLLKVHRGALAQA